MYIPGFAWVSWLSEKKDSIRIMGSMWAILMVLRNRPSWTSDANLNRRFTLISWHHQFEKVRAHTTRKKSLYPLTINSTYNLMVLRKKGHSEHPTLIWIEDRPFLRNSIDSGRNECVVAKKKKTFTRYWVHLRYYLYGVEQKRPIWTSDSNVNGSLVLFA